MIVGTMHAVSVPVHLGVADIRRPESSLAPPSLYLATVPFHVKCLLQVPLRWVNMAPGWFGRLAPNHSD